MDDNEGEQQNALFLNPRGLLSPDKNRSESAALRRNHTLLSPPFPVTGIIPLLVDTVEIPNLKGSTTSSCNLRVIAVHLCNGIVRASILTSSWTSMHKTTWFSGDLEGQKSGCGQAAVAVSEHPGSGLRGVLKTSFRNIKSNHGEGE